MSYRRRRQSRWPGDGVVVASSTPVLPRPQERVQSDVFEDDRRWSYSSTRSAVSGGVPGRRFTPGRKPGFYPALPARGISAHRGVANLFSSSGRPPSLLKAQLRALEEVRARAPSRVRFCVQRKQRKEVLFALGRAGFSGSARGKYRRTSSSQYRC